MRYCFVLTRGACDAPPWPELNARSSEDEESSKRSRSGDESDGRDDQDVHRDGLTDRMFCSKTS